MGPELAGGEHIPYLLAHISDPHVSRRYYRDHIKSLKLLLRAVLDAGCDHVVVTGDIVSTADPDDFALAREIFGTLGLLSADRLTVVPGNHDVFGGPHRATDVLEFPSRIRTVDRAAMRALFVDAFAETFEGVMRPDPALPFPFVKRAGPFDIIGIDSTMPWSLLRNPLGSNGHVDDAQLRALSALAQRGADASRIPVVAMHHHLRDAVDATPDHRLWTAIERRTMRLRGRARLLRRLASLDARVVLHGHVHLNETYIVRGMRVANGAGAVCDDPIPFIKYNTLRVHEGNLGLEIRTLPVPYQSQTLPRVQSRWIPAHAPLQPEIA